MKALIGTPLKRFLRTYRKQNPPQTAISYLLQSVAYPMNVGSIFRIADGAGIEELILTGITPTPPNATIEKVGRYKHDRLKWRYAEDPTVPLRELKSQGVQIIALELTDTAVPYHEFSYSDRVCLVVGHEDHGVTRNSLAHCDASVFIPMYGKGQSLNVHVALSIVTYHILHKDNKA